MSQKRAGSALPHGCRLQELPADLLERIASFVERREHDVPLLLAGIQTRSLKIRFDEWEGREEEIKTALQKARHSLVRLRMFFSSRRQGNLGLVFTQKSGWTTLRALLLECTQFGAPLPDFPNLTRLCLNSCTTTRALLLSESLLFVNITCSDSVLRHLTAFPKALRELHLAVRTKVDFPSLPESLRRLSVNTSVGDWPIVVPNGLRCLEVWGVGTMVSIPDLPDGLTHLVLYRVEDIPPLPASLKSLEIGYCRGRKPELPKSLIALTAYNNDFSYSEAIEGGATELRAADFPSSKFKYDRAIWSDVD